MTTELFYFTGTGNTLFLVKSLANRLGDAQGSITLTPIASLAPDTPYVSEAERIGIFSPVYFLNLPDIVKAFIVQLQAPRLEYFFAASNCGLNDWGVASYTRHLAAKTGLRLDAFFRFALPDSSIVFPTAHELYADMFRVAETNLDRMADTVSASLSAFEATSIFGDRILSGVMKTICFSFYGFKDLRCEKEHCTSCGLCARVCPTANIAMEGGFPRWLDQSRCTSCFACVHSCPSESITFRRQKKAPGFQYRNPKVKTAELMVR